MKYYVQNANQYVGNSMLWWRKKCAGYTCDIKNAMVFDSLEAANNRCWRETDIPWPKEYIDGRVTGHVDWQHCDLEMAGEGAKDVDKSS